MGYALANSLEVVRSRLTAAGNQMLSQHLPSPHTRTYACVSMTRSCNRYTAVTVVAATRQLSALLPLERRS